MAHGENQDERPSEQEEEVGEVGEKTFLKDLHLYMKKRDTPIEKIPHLGFKQIDLFMMYQTVESLGGYNQVTARQIWKQVYNTLGGNPRSTSAATCTRRHYEKLLLPYECHVRGEDYMEVLPQCQQKRLHYSRLSEEDECPSTAKRSMTYRPLQTPLHQNPINFLTDSRVRILPMPVHYRQYYHHPVNLVHPDLLPYVHPPVIPSSQPSSLPSPQGQTDRIEQPLERLRFLAKQYKDFSGWTEPLNLSRKSTGLESGGHPASSFAPPPSNKSPKFLNTASPLYPAKGLVKDEGCETPEGEVPLRKTYPLGTRDGYIIDLTSSSSGGSSHSPIPASGPGMKKESSIPSSLQSRRDSDPSMVHVPKPQKREYTDWPRGGRRGESSKHSPGPLNFSRALPSTPSGTGERMEIQIPLALLHDWVKGGLLCGPAGARPGDISLQGPTMGQTPGSEPRERERAPALSDTSPTILTHADHVVHSHHKDQDRGSGDLRERSLKRQRNLPSPTTTTSPSPSTSPRRPMSPYQFSSYKPQPSGSILRNPDSWNLDPREDTRRPYHPKLMHPQDLWDRAQAIPLKIHPRSQALEQDGVGPTSSAYCPGTSLGRVENPGMALMVNPSSPFLVPLTPEEFMKLKRLISSSS